MIPSSPTDAEAATRQRSVAGGFWRRLTALVRICRRMSDRHHQRLHLAELDDHLRRDIGLTRRQVEDEISKPPWR